MKKLLLIVFASTLISSCNKKENTKEEEIAQEDVAPEEIETPKVYHPIFVQEKPLEIVTPEIVENIVGAHDNDTIYVTNFFATWCGPCIREMPYFKQKMKDLKSEPVKFTFISMDQVEDWETAVKQFAEENQLENHIVLLDGKKLSPDFYSRNFAKWDGSFIPYTQIKKGDRTEEILGSTSLEDLEKRLSSFK